MQLLCLSREDVISCHVHSSGSVFVDHQLWSWTYGCDLFLIPLEVNDKDGLLFLAYFLYTLFGSKWVSIILRLLRWKCLPCCLLLSSSLQKYIFPKHLNSDFISLSFRSMYTVCVILIFLLNRRKYCKDQIQQRRRLTACLKETRRLLLHQLSLSFCRSLLFKTCIPTFLVKQHNIGVRTASKDVGKVKAKTQKLEN